MAQTNNLGFGNQIDLEQMLIEAQHRWLRTPEICEILRNHKRFNIAPEPPNMPPSGSLFLFDRKVLRYFRKDGHSWRKKKDGKTIKEAHERLKAGSIDVLNCYYAHGEDNENFQRRSYWLLEKELSHIVLVHYREVKGYRKFNRFKETEEAIANAPDSQHTVCNPEAGSFVDSGFQQISCPLVSQNTDKKSLNSAGASDYEDAESGSFQTKLVTVSSLETDEDSSSQRYKNEIDSWEWEGALDCQNDRAQSASVKHSKFNVQSNSVFVIPKQENVLGTTDIFHECQASKDLVQGLKKWQVPGEGAMHLGSPCKVKGTLTDSMCMDGHTMDAVDRVRNQPSASACFEDQSDIESSLTAGEKSNNIAALRTLLYRPVKDEILKKSDSFSQWICKELGDLEPDIPSAGPYLVDDDKRSDSSKLSSQAEFDSYTPDPSTSQEQLFRIVDFAPNWGYVGSETKVLITGNFLNTNQDAGRYQFSCMFGEVEVLAEIIADGVLRCYAPPLDVARVQFYVKCSNRLACSDVREFEYRDKLTHGFDVTSLINKHDALQIQFCKLLSLGSRCRQNALHCNWDSSSNPHHEITSLLKEISSEWFQTLELTSNDEFSLNEVKDRLAEKFLKEKLCEWLLCKEAEGGNGLRVLDENGQGVLHLAAALGYDWAISPTVAAGVSINFRDVRGWTALHWAAFYGRVRTVAYLISMGAFAGALTDPTPTHPLGRTSADLASENGHKGIAGFLAESALSAHLECLTLMDSKQDNATEPHGMISVLTASERLATPVSVSGDNLDGLSLKDSLAALRNATQAAARIHQVYRLHSFKRKLTKQSSNDKFENSDEYALSLIALKSNKLGQHNEPVHGAAIRIQNKFRSWKGRKDFVTLRRNIVKIQAHFRGHQVRKHYKAFVWSVGVVEKVILRWRRKRSGLRGFKSEDTSSQEDDFDYLNKGRKQAEERIQKALSRVKSMVRYPEARDQYRSLITTVGEVKELKDGSSGEIDGATAAGSMDDDLLDIDALLNGGTMP